MALSPAARLTLANLFFRQHNGEVESIAKGTVSRYSFIGIGLVTSPRLNYHWEAGVICSS